MEKGISYPEIVVLTNEKEHARNQLEVMVYDKESMYVFDTGYLDYERFDRMADDGYFSFLDFVKMPSFGKSMILSRKKNLTFYRIKRF
jgi:hypothetical protein